MSTFAQVGRNEYMAEIARLRMAVQIIHRQLDVMIENTESGFMKGMLAKIALALVEEDDAINRLDDIGRNSRELK